MKAPMRNSFLAAVATLLLIPAAASADTSTFGSSLQGTPDFTDNTAAPDYHQADTLYFNVSPQNSHKSPVSGQVLEIRIKGRIVPKGGGKQDLNLFHTQVLRPNANGSYTVDSSSQDLLFPVGGDVNEVHTFRPSTQCIRAGDFVDFNFIGGWDADFGDPRGTQYQIYKTDLTSAMNWYEHNDGTNNGSTWFPNQRILPGGQDTAHPQNGRPYQRELMMQVVVGSGVDSSNLCEGGLQGYEYAGVEVQKTAFTVYDDGVAGARLASLSGRGFCQGSARLVVDGAEIGSAPFKIDRNVTTNLDIPLSNEGARLVNSRGTVDATVNVDSRDEVGSTKATTGVATLKSARPTTGGFAGLVVRAQSAGVKGNGFNMTATCPLGTLGACTGKVTVSSQKRVPLRRGSRGKVYKMATGIFTVQPGAQVRVPLKLTSAGKKVLKKVK
jgi:hypothetical protein